MRSINRQSSKGPFGQQVGQYGPKRWSLIASNLPGRTGKQCRERWHNQLDPNIKKEGWSEEEVPPPPQNLQGYLTYKKTQAPRILP